MSKRSETAKPGVDAATVLAELNKRGDGTPRWVWWLVFLGGLAAFGVATGFMAGRIVEFNKKAQFVRFHAEPMYSRKFRLEGWPEGTLTDKLETVEGIERAFLELDYAGQKTLIPVKKPPAQDIPALTGYDEWVKVLAFNQVEPAPNGESRAVPGSTRLWIITRTTPPGYDPDQWGSVMRTDWLFTFYELMPRPVKVGDQERSVVVERRRWPKGSMEENRLQQTAVDARNAIAKGEKPTLEQARALELALIEPLAERSPEYFAAMHVVPKLNVPKYKFSDTAFSFRTLGWTAPVAGLSALAMFYGLAFAVAPRRVAGADDARVRRA